MNYLAIDLGAESGRVILGAIENSHISLKEIHRFANIPIRDGASIHWDLNALIEGINDGIVAISESIHSLSADSWGVDYVLLDEKNEIIRPVYNYRDPRTNKSAAEFLKKVSWEKIFSETGIQFMPINTLFQLAAEPPYRLRSAARILSVGDWVNGYFANSFSAIEESMASTFQLYNPRTRDWSKPLLDALGLDASTLGRVVPSGTVLDSFKKDAAVKVVATCSHDTGCAVAAVPAQGHNWAYLSSGTWSLMGVERAEPIINDKARELNFTNEIGYGGSIRLLKNISGMWLLQECRRAWAEGGQNFDYAELTRLAEAEAGCPSIIDPMDSRFLSPQSMPQAIADFCREHGQATPATPGQFTRCIFESLARLYARTLRQLEELTGQKIDRLHIVGGGSKNSFLNQLTANACGIPAQAGPVEATALGNIIIQAITTGEIADLQAARQMIRRNFPPIVFQPS
jgi:rhamnulokinase